MYLVPFLGQVGKGDITPNYLHTMRVPSPCAQATTLSKVKQILYSLATLVTVCKCA